MPQVKYSSYTPFVAVLCRVWYLNLRNIIVGYKLFFVDFNIKITINTVNNVPHAIERYKRRNFIRLNEAGEAKRRFSLA